jgi:hypothetical protein
VPGTVFRELPGGLCLARYSVSCLDHRSRELELSNQPFGQLRRRPRPLVLRQDRPRVGLHLEVVAEATGHDGPEPRHERLAGRPERRERLALDGDVEVDAPGSPPPPGGEVAEDVGKIRRPGEPALAVRRDHLVEVARLVESPDRLDRGGVAGVHLQGARDLDLADRDPRGLEPRERLGQLLVLDGLVAAVEAERQMLPDGEVPAVEPLAPEPDHLLRGLERRERLRLRTEDDPPPRLLPEPGERARRSRPDVRDGGLHLRPPPPRIEGPGQRADRPPLPLGQQGREHPRDAEGVVEPRASEPVRAVDVLLHARGVEAAVRERVDGEGHEPVPLQRLPEAGDRARVFLEPPRGRRGEMEPDAEGLPGGESVGERPGDLLERGEERGEVLHGEDVRAGPQPDGTAGGLDPHGGSLRPGRGEAKGIREQVREGGGGSRKKGRRRPRRWPGRGRSCPDPGDGGGSVVRGTGVL